MEMPLFMKNRHSCYLLEYHLVVATKFRHPVLVGVVSKELRDIIYDLFENRWNTTVRAENTDLDHVHILFSAPPQVQLSKLVNNFKTVSSRLLRKHHENFLKKYYWKPLFWSDSYFIGAVSDVTDEIVRVYIENQGKKHH
ncbi:MAG: IS200/IS605 family transposase [Anaerolineaceae bacterium]|nr:IS200/IS605 family transposase [Anaerolineaceae bacterium]